jgi:hypothetical protein
MVGHQPYKLAQTVPENRIIQVPSGLIQIPNGVAVGHSASSETRELWKNEPHPMGALTSARKFLDDLRVDLRLSVDEANEVPRSQSKTPIVRLVHQILYAGVVVGSTNGRRVFAKG